MKEIEIRFLDISPNDLQKKLIKLGAKKISDEMLEEWLFAKPEWKPVNGRVRVRKQGEKTEVAYKETKQQTSKGNLELEFVVSDAETALQFLEKLGLSVPRHQQKRRVHYILDNVSIDIDFWPKIPPLVEIEAPTLEQVKQIAEKLGFDMKDKCELDAFQVYKKVYGIDLTEVKELVF